MKQYFRSSAVLTFSFFLWDETLLALRCYYSRQQQKQAAVANRQTEQYLRSSLACVSYTFPSEMTGNSATTNSNSNHDAAASTGRAAQDARFWPETRRTVLSYSVMTLLGAVGFTAGSLVVPVTAAGLGGAIGGTIGELCSPLLVDLMISSEDQS